MHAIETIFLQALQAHSLWLIVFAFIGGIASSLLPCTVGMLPVLIGYVGGYTEDSRLKVFQQIALFMLGFALILTVLGIIATSLKMTFGALIGSGWYYLIGIIAILMGLHLLNVFHIPIPQTLKRMPEFKQGRLLTPFLMGLCFGAASSPCGTPFLTGILGFISHEKNIWLGGASLFAYAFGQSMLLLVIGLFTGLIKHLAILRHIGRVITLMSGIIFILGGLLFIAQGSGLLNLFAFV